VTEGFSLSAAPTTFFLGNANSLTIQIVRAAGFGGSVTLQVGPLPPGITSVQPTSVIAAADTNSAVFQVTAAADPALSGQTVSIAITGSVTGVPPQGFGRAAGEPSAHLTSINATGTLQAPFSVSTGGTSLGTIQVNQPATATVAVAFLGSPAFPGPVSVTASAPAGLTLSGGGSSLSASGSVSFTFTGATPGSYSPQVVAQAGSFIVTTIFSVEVTAPSNPFLLSVLPSTQPLQVNANVPVALQAQILPQLQTFTQTVTVTVTDGSQMKFNPICGNPAGFVSYTAGILTFNVGPPYSSVSFCMSAGQAVNASINSGGDSATVTAAASNSPNIILTYNFQIGVPELVVARATTFTIPAAGSVVANITLNAVSGFNLPVHVHLTGQGSSIGSSGPVEAPLPAGVSSADCGPHPSSQGKDVSPGQTITCTITNTSTSGSTSPITVEVFGVFPVTNPGASVVAFFQVCTLGPSTSISAGARVVRAGKTRRSPVPTCRT
jgi:hypothetical protein